MHLLDDAINPTSLSLSHLLLPSLPPSAPPYTTKSVFFFLSLHCTCFPLSSSPPSNAHHYKRSYFFLSSLWRAGLRRVQTERVLILCRDRPVSPRHLLPHISSTLVFLAHSVPFLPPSFCFRSFLLSFYLNRLLPIPHNRRAIPSHQRKSRRPNIILCQLTLLPSLPPCLLT